MFVVAPSMMPSKGRGLLLSKAPAFCNPEEFHEAIGSYAADAELAVYEKVEVWPNNTIGYDAKPSNPAAKLGFIKAAPIGVERDWGSVQGQMWEHFNRSFMRGNCWHFAVAVHDRIGLPIVGLKERRRPIFAELPSVRTGGRVNHVAIEIDRDDRYFDGRGIVDYDEMAENVCGGDPVFVNLKRDGVARHAGAKFASSTQRKTEPTRVWMSDEDESVHRRVVNALGVFYGDELKTLMEYAARNEPEKHPAPTFI